MSDFEKKAINPFFLGNEFMNYCIRSKYITLEMDEDKSMHYYVTELGKRKLLDDFGIEFGCPCSLENEGR